MSENFIKKNISKIIRSIKGATKVSDILKKEELTEDSCEVCTLHSVAYDKLDNIIYCPHCGTSLDMDLIGRFINIDTSEGRSICISEDNTYNENDYMLKIFGVNCLHCYQWIGFIPIPITYNANHDIFYIDKE